METLIEKPNLDKNYKTPTIVQVFLDADLRSSHKGLTYVASKHNLDLSTLKDRQFVVFINKKQTMMKCFVAGNTITHTKRDHIDLMAISNLPKVFGETGELSYNSALKLSLQKALEE